MKSFVKNSGQGLLAILAAMLVAPSVASAQPQCESPGILVILDRSVSMRAELDGQPKWDIARAATNNILAAHGDAAHFGLMLYPGPSGSGANGVAGAVGACNYNRADAGCSPDRPRCTTGEVVVGVGANTAQQISDNLVLPNNLSHSYTPTWQSLEAALNYQAGRVADRRQFAILITDGYQCCGLINDNGNLSCEPEAANLIPDKVQALTDAGIRTYVVGFGGSTDARTLHRAAIRAGTLRPGCNPDTDNPNADEVCYLQASRGADLGEFLDDIVREINVEVCDGQDNDCDGSIDENLARACNGACGAGEEVCFNGQWGDCNAQNALPEACNNQDDDCDDNIDENISRACATACGQGAEVCRNGNYQDCDAPQPQPEICDGQDNNCDGVIDEGCDCSAGEERACGDNRGRCRPGNQRCLPDGTWGDCEGAIGPEAEICDGEDNDCDGVVDGMERNCQTACGAGTEMCTEGRWQGCNAPDVIAEDCNNLDDDCDGRIDENVSRECSTECGNGIQQCRDAQWTDCSAREPIEEICDNGRDDDCDGAVDDGCDCTDGDTQPCGTNRGACTEGAQTCVNNQWGPCVGGTDPTAETCDGVDNDCDGVADNGELCPTGLICGCGACAEPCTMNECPGESMCIFGHCIEDNCPDGTMCEEGTCVEGGGEGGAGGGGPTIDLGVLPEMGTVSGSGASDDCACDVGKRSGDMPWTLLAFAGLLAIRRRRR